MRARVSICLEALLKRIGTRCNIRGKHILLLTLIFLVMAIPRERFHSIILISLKTCSGPERKAVLTIQSMHILECGMLPVLCVLYQELLIITRIKADNS